MSPAPLRLASGLIALAALAACPSPDPEPLRCFVGDPAAPPELVLIHQTASGTIAVTREDQTVPLLQPPQGGRVMFIGVRARNLDGCPVTITAALFDTCSEDVIALERRPIRLEPTADGWLEPLQPHEISNYSNLPACPRAGLTRDVHGEPYRLLVSIEDKDGRRVEATRIIVPTCAGLFAETCPCECSRDYILGEACEGGVDAGSSPACDGGT